MSKSNELVRTFPGMSEASARLRAVEWVDSELGAPQHWPPQLRFSVKLVLTSPRPMAVWWGDDFRCLWNDAFASFAQWHDTTVPGRPASELWPDLWMQVGQVAERVRRHGTGAEAEAVLLSAVHNGHAIAHTVTVSLTPVLGESSAVDGVLCLLLDEPSQKSPNDETAPQAALRNDEDRVRELEERFRMVIDHSRDVLWALNERAQFAYISPSMERLLGYPIEEVMRHPASTYMTPASADWLESVMGKAWADALATGRPVELERMELEQIRSDGERIWVEVLGNAVYNAQGAFAGVVGVTRDISERKRAEAALAASEEKYRSLFNAAGDGIVVVDAGGRIMDANVPFCRMVGEQHAVLAGAMLREHAFELVSVDRPDIAAQVALHGTANFERVWRRKDGALMQVEVTVTGLGSDQYLAIVHDIGEHLRTEEALAASQAMYRLLAENSSDAVSLIDAGGNVIYASPSSYRRLGYAEDEIVGLGIAHILELIHPDDRAYIAGEIAHGRAHRLPSSRYEYRVRTKSGDYTWLEDYLVREFDENGNLIRTIINSRDITARKRAEEALRASEARLKAIINNTDTAIWSVDREHRLLVANSICQVGVVAQIGRVLEPGESVLPESLPAEYIAFWRESYERALAGERLILETRSWIQHPGGTLEVHLSPIVEEGKITGVVGMSRNITERKRIEAALKASEERLRYALEASSEGIWDWDVRSGEMFVNERWYHQYGYVPGEIQPTIERWAAAIHPDDAADALRVVEEYVQGRSQANRLEHRIITNTGDIRWFQSFGKIVAWDDQGRPSRIVGTNADITERKEAEQRLRASEERFRRVVENSPNIVTIHDKDGRLSYVSPGVHLIMGVPPEHVLQMDAQLREKMLAQQPPDSFTDDELAVRGFAPEDAASQFETWAAVRYCMEHPGEKVRRASSVRAPNGDLHDLETVYQAIMPGATGSEVVSVTTDVTEHKALARLLLQENVALEEQVAARTAELQTTIAALHRANIAKDAFMAAISHELRTPLTGILGISEALHSQTRGPLNPHQERYVDLILESGNQLLETVNSVLRYTSLVAGDIHVMLEQCRVSELCTYAIRAVRDKAERKGQSITLDAGPSELVIESDAEGITRVVSTLLENAIKFTPDGGRTGVRLGRVSEDAVRLEIWDTGPGIDPQEAEHVFEPFTQVDKSRARLHEGLGLGLAYVHKMVELLGGCVSVEREPGAGARFVVILPVSAPAGIETR